MVPPLLNLSVRDTQTDRLTRSAILALLSHTFPSGVALYFNRVSRRRDPIVYPQTPVTNRYRQKPGRLFLSKTGGP